MLFHRSLCCDRLNFLDDLELNIWTLGDKVLRLLIVLGDLSVIRVFLPILIHSHLYSVDWASVALENDLGAAFASWRIRLLGAEA